jgi:hypothetical protein
MKEFKEHLYEATLFAFGKILAKYNAFERAVLLKETGKEILEYLNRRGYAIPQGGGTGDLNSVIDLFVGHGFAASVDIEPAGDGQRITWHDLYGYGAYEELQDYSSDPFLSCPLTAVLGHLAAGEGKILKLREKSFNDPDRTAVSVQEFVEASEADRAESSRFEPSSLANAQLVELAEERARKLEQTLKELKTLQGLLPICVGCKKIRDDRGYWKRLEQYLEEHSEAKFSHGLCPDCFAKLYPELAANDEEIL